ncbi:MAG TPA: protein-glutamate O-methyltransferase [Deltaproteobacteria bacterium]|nr:protein-glutamate O-methyltransferase [Deltaproteobacteria bacterium]
MNLELWVHPYTISDREFALFRDLIFRHTGIHMSDRKKNLVVARLSRRLRALGLGSFSDYYRYLTEGPDAAGELINLVNRITTNKTDFFRERHHFDFLRDTVVPQILRDATAGGQRRIRIWSAGCSSGEEPYSIAMTISELLERDRGWDVRILATDLDTEVLSRAHRGVYSSQQVAPVPVPYLSKYFDRVPDGYELKQAVKGLVVFRKLNLMDETFPMKRSFDAIFCRNVMIYFTEETKNALVEKLHRHLKEGGYLFIGHSESLMHMKHLFTFVRHTVYRKI